MATLEQLKEAVARETAVEQSVITLLEGISQQLKDALSTAGGTIDPALLDQVIADIDANAAKLSAAVVANTPSAPPVAAASKSK